MKEINEKTKEILEKEIKEVEKQYFQTLNDKDWGKKDYLYRINSLT